MTKLTIKEIAREAGVSVSTVSRVLNHPEIVSPELCEKIRRIINDVGYTPNTFARSLKNKRSNIVGVIVTSLEVQFFADIVHVLGSILNQHKIVMFVATHNDDPAQEKVCVEAMIEMQVDAILVATTNANDNYLQSVSNSGIPIILLDRSSKLKDFVTVHTDKENGYYALMNHLYECGSRNFYLVTGGTDILTNYERFQGAARFVFEKNLPLDSLQCYYGDFTVEYGYRCCKKILSENPANTVAILAGSANIAAGVYKYCLENSISIPDKVSVVALGTFKNDFLVKPKLTYLRDMRDELGKMAADIVLDLLFKKKTLEEIQSCDYCLQSEIVYGESTGKIKKQQDSAEYRQ